MVGTKGTGQFFVFSNHLESKIIPCLELTLKSCTTKKSKRSELKCLPQALFFTLALRFSTFRDRFKLVKRAFHGGSTTFLDINLVPD